MSDLQIPDRACAAFLRASQEARWSGDTQTNYYVGLQAAAPLIVAAAYRDVADRLEKGAYRSSASSPVTLAVADGVQIAMALLRHLADELDGGESS